MKRVILLLIMAGFVAGSAFAQSPWLSDTRVSTLSFEWDKPLFDNRTFDRSNVSGASSVLFITGRVRLNDNLRFVAEVPISHFGYEGNNPVGGNDNSTVLGNLYAGGIFDVNTGNPNTHSFVELGVRIPTTPNPNTNKRFGGNTAIFSEVDRREAFTNDNWAIPLIANYITSVQGPFAVKFRLGTVYDIYVDNLKNLDNELYLLSGISGLYRERTFEAQLGLLARNPYVGNNLKFWDDGYSQIRAGIARPFRYITPGVYVRKPLGDNYNRLVDFAYGLSIELRGR